MSILDLFHKRQKKLRGELPDVYIYDQIPETLRVQIIHIMAERLGDAAAYHDSYGSGPDVRDAYKSIVDILRKEFGVFHLPHSKASYQDNYLQELADFVLREADTEKCLSAIELICRAIELVTSRFQYRSDREAAQNAKDSIEEINGRFKEHGIGYEYDDVIVRIDSELVHAEAVKPALQLLREPKYAGAEQEFRSAHSHYRHGKHKEAIVDALKALESTMKIICTGRRWAYQPSDTAKKLIDVCFKNGLVPSFWQAHFASLQQLLEASVPTARNKTSGHGQGAGVQDVPDHIAAYVIHMTASTIVFLVNSDRAMP